MGFKLKKELLEYFTRYVPGFGERYGILKQIARRKEIDTYRFLSAHIHSQSSIALPVVGRLSDVVQDQTLCSELAKISADVDEYISDILFAIFVADWSQLPVELIKSLKLRFKTSQQETTFYATI